MQWFFALSRIGSHSLEPQNYKFPQDSNTISALAWYESIVLAGLKNWRMCKAWWRNNCLTGGCTTKQQNLSRTESSFHECKGKNCFERSNISSIQEPKIMKVLGTIYIYIYIYTLCIYIYIYISVMTDSKLISLMDEAAAKRARGAATWNQAQCVNV